MKGPKRKYLSEFSVGLCSARWLMTTASQINSGGTMGELEQEISNNCHIYLICQIPSVSFVRESFVYKNNTISGEISYKVKGKQTKIPFSSEFPLVKDATKVELSDYPYRELQSKNDSGEIIRYLPASALCFGLGKHREYSELGEYEVLYVGQAYADGKRSAFDRLKSHSTLQKILADAQYKNPDNEIYIMTFEYDEYTIFTQMDGRAKGTIKDHRDGERFFSILDNPLSKYQKVCLTEDALIRYFFPKYNEIYKEHFPSKNHKILKECYQLDFSGLIVEIDTEELELKLFSENIAPKMHHLCQFDLFTPEERYGFFHFTDKDGTTYKMPDVLPST